MTEIVIAPPARFSLPNVKHLWEAREVLLRFGARDVTLRYRQTALGAVWVILQPLLTALVFTLVFGKVAKLPSNGLPYLVFTFSGLLAWNLFSGIIARSSGSLVSNAALVSKVYFPRVLVPMSTVSSVIVDFGVSLAFYGILAVVYQVSPSWALVLLPLWAAMVVIFAAGIGVVLSALMVRYRDVQYVVPFMIQFLLYASPVPYSITSVPHKYRLFFDVNPLSWLLGDFRWSLVHDPAPPLWQIICSVVVPIAVLVGGSLIFEQMERSFADVI